MKMDIINPNAAGIDVGSRSHFVAVGQDESETKEFGVYSRDNEALADWLEECDIQTVALESTGTYWQNLYLVLQQRGFEVILANGKFTKNIKGKLVHRNCKKSPEEIALALNCNHRKDLLFGLKQEYEMYLTIREKLVECDEHMKVFIDQHLNNNPQKKELKAPKKNYKKKNKNAPKNMNMNQIAYQYFNGVDLMSIEGVSDRTVIALMSELGPEGFKKFPTHKHFTSWLRLAPNNKISGGRKLSRRVGKGSNKLKTALRRAANVLGNLKDSHLGQFFRRIAFRKGRVAAITATARKLAVIIWKMVVEKVPYNPPNPYEFRDQKRSRLLKEMRNKINKLNVSHMELGLDISNLQ